VALLSTSRANTLWYSNPGKKPPIIPTNRVSAWFTNFKFAAKKIDVFSRVLFPGVFAVFNFLYWTYFLTREQREREE